MPRQRLSSLIGRDRIPQAFRVTHEVNALAPIGIQQPLRVGTILRLGFSPMAAAHAQFTLLDEQGSTVAAFRTETRRRRWLEEHAEPVE